MLARETERREKVICNVSQRGPAARQVVPTFLTAQTKKFLLLMGFVAVTAGCENLAHVRDDPVEGKAEKYFCREESLESRGDGKLVCNWTVNSGDACELHYKRYLPQSLAAHAPERVHRCGNGSHLVEVRVK